MAHNINSATNTNCNTCHEPRNNYSLTSNLLDVYLADDVAWNSEKEKDMLVSGEAACDDCHHGLRNEHIVDATPPHNRLHDHALLGYDTDSNGQSDAVLSCAACHFNDVVYEHTTRRNISCSTCHESTAVKVQNTITAGMAGTVVFCDNCHNTAAGEPTGNLIANHHLTVYSTTGDCTRCHIVGPGARGPKKPPCFQCHGQGKPHDPQDGAFGAHANGPAIPVVTAEEIKNDVGIKDFRACFSCHLEGGQGYQPDPEADPPGDPGYTGTPVVVPMHALPTGNVYWPTGYYRDATNTWQTPANLVPSNATKVMPANLEDPVYSEEWKKYPGFGNLNYLVGQQYRSVIYHTNDYKEAWLWENPDALEGTPDGEDYLGPRRLVNDVFQLHDYPNVPISYNGDFAIPSYDGSGTIGKPSGSGSLQVTIEPEAARNAGAQWRIDGGAWQTSATTLSAITDRDNHLVEFRPVASWAEPASIMVTINNGQTTTIAGASATYTSCDTTPGLTITRTTGNKSTTFDWTQPEQQEVFLINGWKDNLSCEIWQNTGAALVEAKGFTRALSTDGNNCVLSKNDSTPVTGNPYNLILRASGSSCFRNNAETALQITMNGGGEPSPVGQAGGKFNGLLDSYETPGTGPTSFIHLRDNLYVLNDLAGNLTVLSVDATGTLSVEHGPTPVHVGIMTKVSDTMVALAYSDPTGTDLDESYLQTVRIDADGIVPVDTHLFNTGKWSMSPTVKMLHNSEEIAIVSWRNNGALGFVTLHIRNSGLITEIDRVDAMAAGNTGSDFVHIAADYYAVMFSNSVLTIKIAADGTITNTVIDSYNMGLGGYGEIIKIGDNVFAVVTSTANSPATLKTFSISDTGIISKRLINEFVFEPCSSGHYTGPQISRVADNIFGTYYYEYTGCSQFEGASFTGATFKTIEISKEGRMMTPVILDTLRFKGYNNKHLGLLHITDDIFALTMYGVAPNRTFNGIKIYRISVDNDSDGIDISIDNCPDIANAGQADSDGDNLGDACDNCPDTFGVNQADSDNDTIGDICDPCANDPDNDQDNDGICAGVGFLAPQTGDNDNCPAIANTDQADADLDGIGDICDTCANDPYNDIDGDGFCAGAGFSGLQTGGNDNCVDTANTSQVNSDTDQFGDACDNCPTVVNSSQTDSDCDGAGDACSTPVYYPPTSFVSTPLQFVAQGEITWNDVYAGENGYRMERKTESCAADTQGFTPLTTIYRNDDFAGGIDSTAWSRSGHVKTVTDSTVPIQTSDNSGSASVTWENGAVKLHTVAFDGGETDTGYNNSTIWINRFAEIIGDTDFDIQIDYALPEGAITATQYHVYTRLVVNFPQTNGNDNYILVERYGTAAGGGYQVVIMVDGVWQNGTAITTDLSGKLRLIRKNRKLSGYFWDGATWVLLHTHSLPLTADLVPTQAHIYQYARRNDINGQDLTALIDNFRVNTVGGMPVAMLQMNLDETSWSGAIGEVEDATANANHGTAYNSAATVQDSERGTVGSFDGVDDYVEVSGTTTLESITDSSFTFAAWAKPLSVPAMTDPNPPADDWRYAIVSRPGWHTDLHYSPSKKFRFEIWNSDNPATTDPPADPQNFTVASSVYEPGQWHHVVGVVDDAAKTFSIYVDGQLQQTAGYTGTLRDYGITSYYIGAIPGSAYNWFFDGRIDDVRVFDRALTATEVKALHGNTILFKDNTLSRGTTYCYRVYPIKTDTCVNWSNHAGEIELTTPDNALPTQPINSTPANGATDVYPVTPTLIASVFSDTDSGDTHQASQWQVSTGSGNTFDPSIVYNSGIATPANSHAVTTTMANNTVYYWKVRYQDSKGEWSAYSSETSFTITNNAPATPVNQSPADLAIDVSRTLTLSASPFSDADGGDSHQASQWQISTGSGAAFADAIVSDTGTAAAATSHALTQLLQCSTVYYWRVRYQDSRNLWSAWSAETSFTTTKVLSMFHFDEGSGVTTIDSAGGDNATISGATWTGAGGAFAGANALSFNGVHPGGNEVNWSYSGWKPFNDFAFEAMVKATTTHPH